MDPRLKDSVRNTETLVIALTEAVSILTKEVEKLRKDLKSMKRSTVRKYNKDNGKS